MDNAYIPPLMLDNQLAATPDSPAPKSLFIALLWYAPSCENIHFNIPFCIAGTVVS